MTIKEFIEGFKNNKVRNTPTAPNAVSEYLAKELEVKSYIPFAEKRELCERVLNACNTKGDDGLIKVDSISRYILFTLAIISKYTNLEFSSGEDSEFDSLDEYDMICQAGLLNSILELIGTEYVTCNDMLNMMMSDIETNHNTVEAVLGHALSKVADSLDNLIDALANKVDETNLDLSQIDIDKYAGLLNKLTQK